MLMLYFQPSFASIEVALLKNGRQIACIEQSHRTHLALVVDLSAGISTTKPTVMVNCPTFPVSQPINTFSCLLRLESS